jgi:site-specific DNA recombinase
MIDARKNGTAKRLVRCAVYTRKSTEEGLDQEFNSLHAQREAAEAYVQSQAQEGWTCLAERYDDGGFTGGSMDRPALARLLADIRAGKIDSVIVYKVDRLSRSLLDFAKMMETFEQHQVAFVSVTQQLHTATSMGRLVLNVLLSFAQFEREIISERTRDKIAAARRKGKWSGGHPLLGYDVQGSKLVVNKREAARVRAIFALYLRHQGLIPVVRELERRGWVGKRWVTRKGRPRGGKPFTKTSLHRLLRNVTYIGKTTYKGEEHRGEHPVLVSADVWQKTQALLRRTGTPERASEANPSGAPLRGLVRCVPCGCSMTPSFAAKNKAVRYRYYVCGNAQKRGWAACPSKSIAATAIEAFVLERVRGLLLDRVCLHRTVAEARQEDHTPAQEMTERLQANVLVPHDLGIDNERSCTQASSQLHAAWDGLAPEEHIRILRQVVERVNYDGARGNVSLTFRGPGLRVLVDEWAQRSKESAP